VLSGNELHMNNRTKMLFDAAYEIHEV